jgi:hypothetical protein
MRPLEKRLARSEAALLKCRQRLDEAGDLQAQLKREEDAHSEVLLRSAIMLAATVSV